MTIRSLAVVSLALAGCFGGNKDKPKDPAASTEPPQKSLLAGLKMEPVQVHAGADGHNRFIAGRLEAAVPDEYVAVHAGGQTQFAGPFTQGGQEIIQVVAYRSDTPMDETRQREVLLALNQVGMTAENMIGRVIHVTTSPPTEAKTAWGRDMRFSAMGPMNRMAFHYATVTDREAVMVQYQGNNLMDTPQHAVALIKSFRLVDEK